MIQREKFKTLLMMRGWYDFGLRLGLIPVDKKTAEERIKKIDEAIEEIVREGKGVVK